MQEIMVTMTIALVEGKGPRAPLVRHVRCARVINEHWYDVVSIVGRNWYDAVSGHHQSSVSIPYQVARLSTGP